jgi:polyisoprenoid-binding protein YceI
MIKYAALLSGFALILSLAIPGKPVAPVGPWQVDNRHSDAQLVTDATTNYGKTKINFTIGISRITGKVRLDNDDPSKSSFDITMYPANSMTPPIGEDGKIRSQWIANLANHTLVCFHSKGVVRAADGRLRTTGTLVLTRVDRNVELDPSEAYSGPVYGPPMVHRVTREATFVFDPPAAASQKNDPKSGELLTSGSTNVINEDFPQLLKAVLGTYWPPVVQDEDCQVPSNVGEDFSGPHCTGTFLDTPGLPQEPRTASVGEDYPAPSNFSAIVGNHLTISVHLRLKPAASETRADAGN